MSYIRTSHAGPYTLYSYCQSAYEIEAPTATLWLFGDDAAALHAELATAERLGLPAEMVIGEWLDHLTPGEKIFSATP